LKTVGALLEAGVKVNLSASHAEDTPLLRAVSADNKDICRMLLGAGARDDFAYRKALEIQGDCLDLAPLMCSLSRLSDTARIKSKGRSGTISDQPMPDSTLMLPPPPDSNCKIIWGVAIAPSAKIYSRTENYRLKMYEKAHSVFCGTKAEDGELAIACVSKWPETSQCLTLLVSKSFEYEFVNQSKLEDHLAYVVGRYPQYTWKRVPEAYAVHMRSHVLGMEMRLTRRCINCAVVFASKDQWREEDMFDTPMSDVHRDFLRAIGKEMRLTDDWEHHNGGLPSGKSVYYTSFRGFEIVFHVASMLTKDERRQYIGNDKVLLYVCENGIKPIVPRFRGEVNSAAVVIQKRSNGWKMGCFTRERVTWRPQYPGTVMELDQVREYVLSSVIDANAAVMKSPPYDLLVRRVLQDQIKAVFPTSDQRKSANFLKVKK
jgi:hypothetical protein